MRKSTFAVWFGACLGSVAVDSDHLISLIFKSPSLWSILHQPWVTAVFIGLAFASAIGLYTGLVLRKHEN